MMMNLIDDGVRLYQVGLSAELQVGSESGCLGSALLKLILRLVVSKLWFVRCDKSNDFHSITVLPDEIILFAMISFSLFIYFH